MKKYLTLATIALCFSVMAQAQKSDRKVLSSEEREMWLTELRNYKREFLARELELTSQQEAKFMPVYEQMDDELSRIATETRELETKVSADADASDTEAEAAARALFEQKSREGKVEMEYFDQFKEILTSKQLLRLKNAERKFTQQLVRHHGKVKASGKRQKQ